VIEVIVGLKADVEYLKTALGSLGRIGAVERVDAQRGYRLKLGEGEDGPYLSPWYPHPETGKSSVPLEKGQVVGVLNPSGDPRQGVLLRGGYSPSHASPNENMAANVFAAAGVRAEVVDGRLVVTAGDVTLTLSGAGLAVSGGRVEHDGRNIGSTHRHGGVRPGGASTDVPDG